MNISASTIWNKLNHTNIITNRDKQLLLPRCYWWWLIGLTEQWMMVMKYECEFIKNMECVRSYKNCDFDQNKQLVLPGCSWWWSIELTKPGMWFMKYECECIKNVECDKSYKKCIQPKQTTALTLLFRTMLDWIDETMSMID